MRKVRQAARTEPSRSRLIPGCALFLLISCVMGLSSERLIFTTSYPSPAGIYQTLTVTGQTVLARDGGRVEIGPQAAPNEGGELFLRGGGANPAVFIDNFSGRFRIVTQTGPAERVSVLQNGRVGIGWAAPEQMLDVGGNIQSRGTRTYLRGWDAAANHWIMAGGVTEGTNNALGFNVGSRVIAPGPGWTLQGAGASACRIASNTCPQNVVCCSVTCPAGRTVVGAGWDGYWFENIDVNRPIWDASGRPYGWLVCDGHPASGGNWNVYIVCCP